VAVAVPPGTLAVGGGLLILGLAAYGYLALAGRSLGPEAFAPVAAMWVLVNSAGPGAFQPLEQEVARAVAARHAHSVGARPTLVKAAVLGAGMLFAFSVLAVVARGSVTDVLLGGQGWLLMLLLVTLAGTLLEHLTRGAFAGAGHFGRYGTQLAVDGGIRLVGAALLAAYAVDSPVPFGAVLAAAVVTAALVTAPRPHRLLAPGPPAAWGDITNALGLLLVASVCSQLLVNAGPLAVAVLADPGDRAATGQFLAGLVVARVPLFLMAAVQAALLPGLSRLAALGKVVELKNALVRLLRLILALAASGVLGCVIIGPEVERLLFGPDLGLGRSDLVLLAVSTGFFMVSAVLAQALIACRAYGASALTWVLGVITFAVALLLPGELVLRVEWALVVGTGVTVLVSGLFLVERLRRPLALAGSRPSFSPTTSFEG
jgi:O-antigen/teichoic acid export membrane protein